MLEPVGDDDARAVVLHARVLEASGLLDDALGSMRAARQRFEGDVYVHLQAAAMFERLGLEADSQREQETARLLQPTADAATQSPVELEGLGAFLGNVNKLLQTLEPQKLQAAPQAQQTPARKD